MRIHERGTILKARHACDAETGSLCGPLHIHIVCRITE